MPRYKLTIEYDGARYVGWQRQKNGYAVQEAIETALKGFVGEDVTIFGAGRTDAGVHAAGQVAHVGLVVDHQDHGGLRLSASHQGICFRSGI